MREEKSLTMNRVGAKSEPLTGTGGDCHVRGEAAT
jgi:hypothetical protein